MTGQHHIKYRTEEPSSTSPPLSRWPGNSHATNRREASRAEGVINCQPGQRRRRQRAIRPHLLHITRLSVVCPNRPATLELMTKNRLPMISFPGLLVLLGEDNKEEMMHGLCAC